MSKRRGRERGRPDRQPGCVCLTGPGWWVSVDARTGRLAVGGAEGVAAGGRDAVTAAVLAELRKHGWEPADPLEVRDFLFG